MVRINLIPPKQLTDQHLIAEYNEILMLLGHIKKFPNINNQPKKYCLGSGHINFFKDKLIYLKKRHELIKKEMKNRGFKPLKTINLNQFNKKLKQDYKPNQEGIKIIKERLKQKVKQKPKYYKYYGENISPSKYIKQILKS